MKCGAIRRHQGAKNLLTPASLKYNIYGNDIETSVFHDKGFINSITSFLPLGKVKCNL